jgi:hypothetical protein
MRRVAVALVIHSARAVVGRIDGLQDSSRQDTGDAVVRNDERQLG